MARKTPPVSKQVVDPQLESIAYLKARLIDFDTGSAQLEEQHKAWLRKQIDYASRNSMYHIRLVGYASRRGDPASNSNLSYERASAVLKFMQSLDSKAGDRVETLRAVGDTAAWFRPSTDDDAVWRAVEVHIYIGDALPPPIRDTVPFHRTREVLPGGSRYTKWEVASPGGVFVAEIFGGGFNVFFIRNTELGETRGYIQPVLGVGASVSVSGLKMAWNLAQQFFTGWQFSKPDYTPVTSRLPVTWSELEDSLVRVASAGAGVVGGYAISQVTFTAAGVWQYGPSDTPLRLPGGFLFHFFSHGTDYQLGVGASEAVGPLHRVDN